MLTRLQAINQMLSSVGEQVALVEIEGAGDFANCSTVLDAATRKVLSKGCYFNTEKDVELTPDAAGKIALPPNVLQVDPVDDTLQVVQRGAFLYDKEKRSDVFTAPVTVEWVLDFPFESVPFPIQQEIVARAAMRYQRSYVGSPALDQFAQAEAIEAVADAADAESDSDDYNILDNPDLAYLRRRFARRTML